MKTTFIATAPDGTQIKRTSVSHFYTHAVLCYSLERPDWRDPSKIVPASWGWLGFASSKELAEKAARSWHLIPGRAQIIIVPVKAYRKGQEVTE